MKKLIVFDNNGETFDRFTIIDKISGNMIGASCDPFNPQGFGQHCGNPAHTFFCTTIGATYMSNLEAKDPNHYKRIIKRKTAEIIQEFISEGNIGRVIDFDQLPAPVQQFAKQSFETVTA